MKRNKCNDVHKFGPFFYRKAMIKRTCLCCSKTNTYPATDEIKKEIKKQDEAKRLLSVLINGETAVIKDSDSLMMLFGCVLDNISYVCLNKRTIKKLITRITNLNKTLNKDEKRFDLTNRIIDYIKKFFNKEQQEIEKGIGGISEKLLNLLDDMYFSIVNDLNNIIFEINNKKYNLFDNIMNSSPIDATV